MDKVIVAACGAIVGGLIWLVVIVADDIRQQTQRFKQVCAEQKGTVVYNGRNLECLK
jgi:hypothetical protein